MAGIYIHIPFCKSRCAYCDFYSTTLGGERENYVRALCSEIVERRGEMRGSRVRSIYIGGGTPSVLATAQLRRILDCVYKNYEVEEDAEVTMEMNPDDVVIDDVVIAIINHQSSINRISLGIQTFDDALLRLIRRRHDAQTAVEAVRRLQEVGISNISIDLIYGLPGQTLEMWERDLDTAFSLDVQHLSAYALSYEEGTALARWRAEGRVEEVPEDVQVQMYERLCERTRAAGFEHYEISNFALPGYHSRHNSSYWTGAAYLGFGPGAHSYDGARTRRANKPDLTAYREGVESLKFKVESLKAEVRGLMAGGRGFKAEGRGSRAEEWFTTEVLTDDELYDEAVMCGLRTAHGVQLEAIERRFGLQRLDYLLQQAAPHLRAGRLAQTDGRLHLTVRSLMVSDDIMSDLMA